MDRININHIRFSYTSFILINVILQFSSFKSAIILILITNDTLSYALTYDLNRPLLIVIIISSAYSDSQIL